MKDFQGYGTYQNKHYQLLINEVAPSTYFCRDSPRGHFLSIRSKINIASRAHRFLPNRVRDMRLVRRPQVFLPVLQIPSALDQHAPSDFGTALSNPTRNTIFLQDLQSVHSRTESPTILDVDGHRLPKHCDDSLCPSPFSFSATNYRL
jgi:hypothetical protein